jgi:hypothetical protein
MAVPGTWQERARSRRDEDWGRPSGLVKLCLVVEDGWLDGGAGETGSVAPLAKRGVGRGLARRPPSVAVRQLRLARRPLYAAK